MRRRRFPSLLLAAATAAVVAAIVRGSPPTPRTWLAGDSHVHSHWSLGYDRTRNPPGPRRGGDAIYPITHNAVMARRHGLAWMVTTDHGGPNHSRVNLYEAYPELLESRETVPEVLQFYGVELNMPGMDHHTLIVPRRPDEWSALYEVESRFDTDDAWPDDASRDTDAARVAALEYVTAMAHLPVLLANHPSRSATGLGAYGLDEPRELRANHELAPEVYRGMEGAPGHQAAGMTAGAAARGDAASTPGGFRGLYESPGGHTLGGFDQMTAIVGGVWDALLGEGRRFWIVAASDSHVHHSGTFRRGYDFWPGEYQKTYVYARHEYDDVLEGLRHGRIFAVTGDLVTRLEVFASGGGRRVGIGDTLVVGPDDEVDIEIQFEDPRVPNGSGNDPMVHRVDVIVGEVRGRSSDARVDRNDTTRVIARFPRDAWSATGDRYRVTLSLSRMDHDAYIRVRGTSTDELEPGMDEPGEDPWTDLWFYTNPIFIEIERATDGLSDL